ncbi:hypothetical protein DNTS_015350 [Danionella cerebrum]|uniref:SAM domain-containing protein n=1 Tax=Danionella cerebrum TaxID=2873325 RepID=A0A553NWT6_9TELE|nr:hypothetical protein DNTS_015350 [Danionella translucida]
MSASSASVVSVCVSSMGRSASPVLSPLLWLRICEDGDLERARSALETPSGSSYVDVCDEVGNTGLMFAAAGGHEPLARLLLRKGASVDQKNHYGWTALMQAARAAQLGIARLLLDAGADVNTLNRLGVSVLSVCVRGGQMELAELLLEVGARVDGCGTDSDSTPGSSPPLPPLLAAALPPPHPSVLELLLEWGCSASVTQPDTGHTALMLAAAAGSLSAANTLSAVHTLLSAGIDPSHTSALGHTALQIARMMRSGDVCGLLEQHTILTHTEEEKKRPDIFHALKLGQVTLVHQLLQEDPGLVNKCNGDGASPLMMASVGGDLELVKLLVEKKANVNTQDTHHGWTALMQATYHGNKEVVRFLLEQGADVNLRAKNGYSAFDLLMLLNDPDTELVRLLASVCMQVDKERSKSRGKSSMKRRPSLNLPPPDDRGGLKSWWNRMSNRFRRLKLTNTLRHGLSTNRLAPFPLDSTMRAEGEPDSELATAPPAGALGKDCGLNGTGVSKDDLLITTMLRTGAPLARLPNEQLKAVIPPFLPPSSFDSWKSQHTLTHTNSSMDCGKSERCGSQPTHRETASISRAVSRSIKFPSITKGPSPSNSGNYSSAHSSSGANGIGRKRAAGVCDTKAHTADAPPQESENSETHSRQKLEPKKPPPSANSSKSTSSTLTPSHTPSASPTPKDIHSNQQRSKSITDEDELSGILRKLSLEKYQPIFEEQEVDMEAFLTLTDRDLQELGINSDREQILSAITELNAGKTTTPGDDEFSGLHRLQLQKVLLGLVNVSRRKMSLSYRMIHTQRRSWRTSEDYCKKVVVKAGFLSNSRTCSASQSAPLECMRM